MFYISNVKDNIDKLLAPYNYEYAYLTKFGSFLYGTNNENSDVDLKGLYFPHIEELLMQQKNNAITYSSSGAHGKNSPDDVDIQLWSVQYWLYLLRRGDTNAIDLLFSMYTKDNSVRLVDIEKCKELLGIFYDNPISLIDLKNNVSYVSYAVNQSRRYSFRGSRMEILKNVLEFFKDRYNSETKYNTIDTYFDKLLEQYGEQSLLFERETNNERCIWLLGKGHCGSVKLDEMIERLETEYNKFGHRAENAMRNDGIDWKAVSHAVRCCLEVIEMADTEFLQFPLNNAEYIREVKEGKKSWPNEVEKHLQELLSEAKDKLSMLKENENMYKNHSEIVKRFYLQ